MAAVSEVKTLAGIYCYGFDDMVEGTVEPSLLSWCTVGECGWSCQECETPRVSGLIKAHINDNTYWYNLMYNHVAALFATPPISLDRF